MARKKDTSTASDAALKSSKSSKPTGTTKKGQRGKAKEAEKEGERLKWTDELVQIMLAELTDNPEIKQGLFPGPGTVGLDNDGAPVTKSNSRPKKEYHYMLAEAVFGADTSEYKLQFDNDVKEAAGRDLWSTRVKNKLEELVSKFKKAKDSMGETGAGLTSEEQIDMSMKNHLTTAWSKVKKTLPCFFTLRDIIGERPNITPVGLGNNDTPIDTSFLHINSSKSSSFDDSFLSGGTSPIETDASKDVDSADEKEEDELNSSEDDLPEKVIPLKRKQPSDTGDSKSSGSKVKRGPKEGGSEKAALGKSGRKSQNPVDKFVDLTKAEELTLQKRLELRREKASVQKEIELERIRVAGTTKVGKEKVRADFELEKLRLQQEHELRMIRLRQGSLDIYQTPGVGSSSSTSSGFQTPDTGFEDLMGSNLNTQEFHELFRN
ncbi:hypothetical protein C8R42DRAFT_656032 [Lentinula raphanica]|nr:hypothetical protein C8R42DRAFT_656032 [Lentinula raphanica]